MARDPIKRKEYLRLRGIRRRGYFREYRRAHPSKRSPRTSLGYQGEELGLKVLVGSERVYRPCDLSWKGKLVDVKTANLRNPTRGIPGWRFLLTKQRQTADLYLIICKDLEGKVDAIYLIPNKDLKVNTLYFNQKTCVKYSKYLLSITGS